ncbi:hypothetical protein CRH20_16190, partial [Listeria monocytogenes]|nr:hypothetical protein [Listeria monocytogenes]EAF2786841.1 hypothetical protein [Listeria monocytogenes]
KSTKDEINQIETDITEIEFKINNQYKNKQTEFQSKLEILDQQKAELESQLKQVENSTTYIEKQSELEMIEEKLRDEKGSSINAVAEIQIKIDKLNAEASDLKADLAKFDSNQKQE